MRWKNRGDGLKNVNSPDSVDVTVIRNKVSQRDMVLISFNSEKETMSYALDPHAFLQLYAGLKDLDDEIRKIGYA